MYNLNILCIKNPNECTIFSNNKKDKQFVCIFIIQNYNITWNRLFNNYCISTWPEINSNIFSSKNIPLLGKSWAFQRIFCVVSCQPIIQKYVHSFVKNLKKKKNNSVALKINRVQLLLHHFKFINQKFYDSEC